MLRADAEQLLMTDATTPEARIRHTTVNIHADFANYEFENIDRGKDERLVQEFPRGQEFRSREKKINGL